MKIGNTDALKFYVGDNEVDSTFLGGVKTYGRLWTPLDMTMALWLDASDGSTLWADGSGTVPATGSVQRWDDKSGNNEHATALLAPVISSNTYNGLTSLAFSNDELNVTNLTLTASASIFVLVRNSTQTSAGSIHRPIFCSDVNPYVSTSTGYAIGMRRGNTAGVMCQYPDADLGEKSNQFLFGGDGKLVLINLINDNGSASFYVNAVLRGANTANRTDGFNTGYEIGRQGSGGSGRFYVGDICEIIVKTSAASSDERQKTEGYIFHKWGMTEDLPSDHPYKNNPPIN